MESLFTLVMFLEKYAQHPELGFNVRSLQSQAVELVQKIISIPLLNSNEISLLGNGYGKLMAIKAYRERNNVSLLQAKNAVEDYMYKTFSYKSIPNR